MRILRIIVKTEGGEQLMKNNLSKRLLSLLLCLAMFLSLGV